MYLLILPFANIPISTKYVGIPIFMYDYIYYSINAHLAAPQQYVNVCIFYQQTKPKRKLSSNFLGMNNFFKS